MPHFCATTMKVLKTDWFPSLTDAQIRALPYHGGNLAAINAFINAFFDAHVAHPIRREDDCRVCVPLNCPDPWPMILTPVWLASNQAQDQAAMFLGNLFCRVAIARKEMWVSTPYPIFTHRDVTPRRYALASDFTAAMLGH
jgi:hypothetical protein